MTSKNLARGRGISKVDNERATARRHDRGPGGSAEAGHVAKIRKMRDHEPVQAGAEKVGPQRANAIAERSNAAEWHERGPGSAAGVAPGARALNGFQECFEPRERMLLRRSLLDMGLACWHLPHLGSGSLLRDREV
jgi:hypothetical protein